MARVALRPDARGYFGPYGGRYVPETLIRPLGELARGYDLWSRKRSFRRQLRELLTHYAGRPTPLYHAERLSERLGGAQIYLKREDLLLTGSHKLNNAIGQALLARTLGKERVIAETGAGQHGVATATAAALVGLECTLYMGAADIERQRLNVDFMKLLGAEVVAVESGTQTLKDALNEALRDWAEQSSHTHLILGSAVGPDPYPRIVRDFHRVIGDEARRQLKRQAGTMSPSVAVACVGGGSNALGLFTAFLDDRRVRMIGVEAGGAGKALGQHAARFSGGQLGVLHGTRTMVLQNEEGQIAGTHSVAPGLDYPLVGPELVLLRDAGRIEFTQASDAEAIAAFHLLSQTEGILPALESAHALAHAVKVAPRLPRKHIVLVNLSGRGDKDLESVLRYDAEHGQGEDDPEAANAAVHPAARKWAGPKEKS